MANTSPAVWAVEMGDLTSVVDGFELDVELAEATEDPGRLVVDGHILEYSVDLSREMIGFSVLDLCTNTNKGPHNVAVRGAFAALRKWAALTSQPIDQPHGPARSPGGRHQGSRSTWRARVSQVSSSGLDSQEESRRKRAGVGQLHPISDRTG